MSLEFNGELDRLLEYPDEPIPLCNRCGLQLECSYELSSGLCWICEKQPKPPEDEQP